MDYRLGAAASLPKRPADVSIASVGPFLYYRLCYCCRPSPIPVELSYFSFMWLIIFLSSSKCAFEVCDLHVLCIAFPCFTFTMLPILACAVPFLAYSSCIPNSQSQLFTLNYSAVGGGLLPSSKGTVTRDSGPNHMCCYFSWGEMRDKKDETSREGR
jgi:hypothetical protein